MDLVIYTDDVDELQDQEHEIRELLEGGGFLVGLIEIRERDE